jgi:transmembrane sensor
MYLRTSHIKRELTRYLSGECTMEESRVISGLIESDKRYSVLFKQLSETWKMTAPKAADFSFNADHAWDVLNNRISEQTIKVIPIVKPQRNNKALTANLLKIAAVLLIGFGIFQWVVFNNPMKSVNSDGVSTVPVELSDGSKVFLNSSSSIKFPENFTESQREVLFFGEAFFEITPDALHPFIIEAGETRIKVLGTSFNVKAYPENGTIEVVVNSGKVLFYAVNKKEEPIEEVILVKGEKGIFDRNSKKISRLINDEPNYLSWKTGILVFNGTTLDKVFSVVGKKYGVNFNVNNKELCQLKLTATFDNESLDAVLEVLKLVHNLQIVNNGKDYLVEKKAG